MEDNYSLQVQADRWASLLLDQLYGEPGDRFPWLCVRSALPAPSDFHLWPLSGLLGSRIRLSWAPGLGRGWPGPSIRPPSELPGQLAEAHLRLPPGLLELASFYKICGLGLVGPALHFLSAHMPSRACPRPGFVRATVGERDCQPEPLRLLHLSPGRYQQDPLRAQARVGSLALAASPVLGSAAFGERKEFHVTNHLWEAEGGGAASTAPTAQPGQCPVPWTPRTRADLPSSQLLPVKPGQHLHSSAVTVR